MGYALKVCREQNTIVRMAELEFEQKSMEFEALAGRKSKHQLSNAADSAHIVQFKKLMGHPTESKRAVLLDTMTSLRVKLKQKQAN